MKKLFSFLMLLFCTNSIWAQLPITGTANVCVGATTNLSDATPGGTWSASNANATVGLGSGVVTGVTAGTVTISYTVAGSSVTMIVTINALPTINVSAAPSSTICLGASTTLTATGAVSYVWTPATALSATTGASVVASPTASATYSVSGTDANGCVNSTFSAILVSALPTVVSATGNTACSGASTSISAVPSTSSFVSWFSQLTGGTFVGYGSTLPIASAPSSNTNYYAQANTLTGNSALAMAVSGTSTYISLGFTISVSNPIAINSVDFRVGAGTTTVSVYYRAGNATQSNVANSSGWISVGTITVVPTGTPNIVNIPFPTPLVFTPGNYGLYFHSTGRMGYTSGGSGASNADFSMGSGVGISGLFTGTVLVPPRANCTIRYSSATGCASSTRTSATLTVNPSPSVSVTPGTSFCPGGSTVATASGTATSYRWSPATGLSATTGASVTATPSITTTYSVVGTLGTCTLAATTGVTVNSLPSVSAGSDRSVCRGTGTTLTGTGGVSYSWAPATGLSATTGTNVIASPTTTTTYTVTGTSAQGCVNTATVTVSVNALPSISGGSNVAICIGGPGTTLTGSGAGAGGSYSWAPASGLSATTGATITANPTVTRTYTVTGTNTNGCSNTASVTVSVNSLPTVGVSPNIAVCQGSNTVLTATGATTYSWLPASGLSASTGATVTASPSGTTTYTVTGTTGICSNTATVSVSVNTLPSVSAGSNRTVCAGTGTTLTGTGGVSYSWAPAAGLSATTGTNVVASPTTTTTYTVTGTSAQGCVNTATVTVSVNALPTISAGTNVAICIGGPGTTLTGSGAGAGGNYSWAPASGLSASTGTTITANPTVTTTYTVSGTNTNGCINTASVTVSVNSLPTVGVSPNIGICAGSSTVLTATGASTYTWSPGSGLSASTGATVTASPLSSTTYTVTGTTGICSNTATVTVSMSSLLPLNATGTATICPGASTPLSATGATTYSWSPATGLSSVTGASVTASPAVTTTYTVTGSAPGECDNTATVTVSINTLAAPGPITGPTTICTGAGILLTGATGGGVWSSSNMLKATVDAAGNVTGIAAGTANISYTVSNACTSAVATFAVTISNSPSVITGASSVCVGSIITLTNTPAGGTWSSPDATVTVHATNGKVTGISPGTAQISYSTSGGCTATTTVTITSPPGAITGTLSLCPGSSTTLVPSVSGGTWSSSTAAKASINETTGEVTAISAGVVVITYTTGAGCYATVPFTVNPIPAAIIGALTICPGTSSDLHSTTPSGIWSSSNPAIATVNSSTGLVTSTGGAGTATIEYNVGALCTRAVNVTIAASSPNVGTPVICLGQATAVLPLTNATPGGNWTSSNPGRIEVSPMTGLMNGLSAGTAVITYTLNAGCFSTTIVSVGAAIGTITGVTNICPGNTSTLSCLTPGGTWSSSNAVIASTGTGAVVTGLSAGIATITYQVASGCYKTTNLTVNGAITPIGGIDSVCVGSVTTLTSSPAGGTWSCNNTTRANINITSGVLTGLATGTVVVSYKLGSSGCFVTKTVTVNPSLPAITGTLPVCPGASVTLANATSGGSWTSSNTARATIDDASGQLIGISSGVVAITYATSPTCYKTTNQYIYPAPVAISGVSGMCVGTTAALTSSGSGVWSSTNTAAATISASGELTGLEEGVTSISYIYPGSGCYTYTDVTINPVPANISGTLNVCAGATTTLTSDPDGGIWSSSNPIKATVDASSGVVSALAAGTANISYTLATGCYKKAIVTVNTVPAPVNGIDSVCEGQTTAMSTTTGGGTWSSSNTATATVHPTSGVVRGMDAGVATISYRLSTAGCASVRQITVNSIPGSITGGTNICIGAPQTLSSSGGGVWSSSNTLKATVDAGTGQVSGISAGTANITYTLPTGCYRKTAVNINTNPGPISGAASVNYEATTTLTCAPGGGSWMSFDPDIASVIATNGIVTGVNEGTTTIMYQLMNGCYSTTEISVTTPAGRQSAAAAQQHGSRLFSIAPNPTSGMLTITANVTGVLAVYSMDGRMVSETLISGTAAQVVLPSHLANGMYICKFTGDDGRSDMVRLVYEK